MMEERIAIVSADCHAGPDRYEDYRDLFEARLLPDFDDYVAKLNAYEANYSDGLSRGGAPSMAGDEGLFDMAVRERCLDADGISVEIMFTQGSIPFGQHPAVGGRDRLLDYPATPAQQAAGCRAYNRWLADFCARGEAGRHLGVARIALADVDAAVAEVEWASKAGLRGGVALPPMSDNSQPFLNDPIYEPLWAACAAEGMVLNMHGAADLTYGAGPDFLSLTLAECDWFSHRGLAHLVYAGVFERHPGLHLAITEQRTHWLAPLLDELDSIYLWRTNAMIRERLPRLPSDYFRTNCFIGASFLSRPECEKRGEIGNMCYMWGSDYPHGEGTWPYTETSLRWTFGCGVSPDELRAMLGGNAARCYGIDLEALRPVAERVGPSEASLRVPVDRLPGDDPADGFVMSAAFRRVGAWH